MLGDRAADRLFAVAFDGDLLVLTDGDRLLPADPRNGVALDLEFAVAPDSLHGVQADFFRLGPADAGVHSRPHTDLVGGADGLRFGNGDGLRLIGTDVLGAVGTDNDGLVGADDAAVVAANGNGLIVEDALGAVIADLDGLVMGNVGVAVAADLQVSLLMTSVLRSWPIRKIASLSTVSVRFR